MSIQSVLEAQLRHEIEMQIMENPMQMITTNLTSGEIISLINNDEKSLTLKAICNNSHSASRRQMIKSVVDRLLPDRLIIAEEQILKLLLKPAIAKTDFQKLIDDLSIAIKKAGVNIDI
jgi:hypothetical protein